MLCLGSWSTWKRLKHMPNIASWSWCDVTFPNFKRFAYKQDFERLTLKAAGNDITSVYSLRDSSCGAKCNAFPYSRQLWGYFPAGSDIGETQFGFLQLHFYKFVHLISGRKCHISSPKQKSCQHAASCTFLLVMHGPISSCLMLFIYILSLSSNVQSQFAAKGRHTTYFNTFFLHFGFRYRKKVILLSSFWHTCTAVEPVSFPNMSI